MIRKKSMVYAALLSAALLALGSMSGCGKDPETSGTEAGTEGGANAGDAAQTGTQKEEFLLKNLDVDKYVTLGDYKNLKVEKSEPSVDEKDLKDLMDSIYNDSFPEELSVKDRAVEVGDTANIDFEGKKDGIAFDGGTAQGTNLTIGSGAFIDGFEDGLVGVMPGETVDLPLTFPAIYPNNPDLAGQQVVFTVTVNYIIPAEKTDEAVKTFGVEDVTTVEELRQYVYDYLYEYSQQEADMEFEEKVLDGFMNACTFAELPQELLEDYRAKTTANISAVAESMGTDANTYIQYYYGMDLESFLDTYTDTALRQNIALQAVANREGLRIEDEELNQTLTEYATNAGYSTVEEFMGDSSIEEFRDYLMTDKVFTYLLELAGGETK